MTTQISKGGIRSEEVLVEASVGESVSSVISSAACPARGGKVEDKNMGCIISKRG